MMAEANRPRRSRKEVSYTLFDGNDDSDDFASFTPPVTKKSKKERRDGKGSKRQTEKSKQPKRKSPKERSIHRKAVDDRIYDKELELALEMSKVESASQDQGGDSNKSENSKVSIPAPYEKVIVDVHIAEEKEAVHVTETLTDETPSAISSTIKKNGRLPTPDIGDEINVIETLEAGTEDGQTGGRSRRRAATTAADKQRQLLQENDEDGDYEETGTGDKDDGEFKADDDDVESSDGGNDDDAEDEDFSFSPKKKKRKGSGGETTKMAKNGKKPANSEKRSKTPKKGKTPVNRKQSTTPQYANENKSPKKPAAAATRKTPLRMREQNKGFTPPTTTSNSTSKSPNLPDMRHIKRKPVVISPKDSNGSNPLGGVRLVSPGQPFRLGLSRFARIKPLHDTG